MWADPATGRRRTVWAFVMVLAGSRHMLVRPTLLLDQHEWTAAHGRRSRSSVAGDWRGGIYRRQVLTLLPGVPSAGFRFDHGRRSVSSPARQLFTWFSRMWT
jgi:hypothetical protein